MNTNIKSAFERLASLQMLLKINSAEFLSLDDVLSNLELANEEINELEDEVLRYKAKNNELCRELDELEDELERCASFPVESLEDEFKIEILKRLYKEKSLIQLDDMIKQ